MEEKKIFDDFPKVDCEECERYHINQCDGVSVGSSKPCKEFLATRRLNTPQEIKSLQKGYNDLRRGYIIQGITLCLMLLNELLERWIL